jgi:hypothetical protein
MPSRNTLRARKNGYSDIKRMEADNPRTPTLKNYRTKTGKTIDSGMERQSRGKHPADPPTMNRSHWVDNETERRIRKENWR